MKIGVLLTFILLWSLANSEALQVFSVSSSSTAVNTPSGSVNGGTTIFIRGVGFSTNAADNQVYLGNIPCEIPADGAT